MPSRTNSPPSTGSASRTTNRTPTPVSDASEESEEASHVRTTRAQTAAAVAMRQQNVQLNGENELDDNGKRANTSDRSFLQEYEEDGTINVGPEYQAEIPEFNPTAWKIRDADEENSGKRRSICNWIPQENGKQIQEDRLDQYIRKAKDSYNISCEQALGILYQNEYNIQSASKELSVYRSMSSVWSKADQILFEQAFSFNGKVFRRIKQMLADKSVRELVEYYYTWKKKRRSKQVSHVERLAKKRKALANNHISDEELIHQLFSCTNCKMLYLQLQDSRKGLLCGKCFLHWRRTGQILSVSDSTNIGELLDTERETPRIVSPPSDFDLNVIAFFDEMAPAGSIGPDRLASLRQMKLKKLEESINQLRLKAQENKTAGAAIGPLPTVRQGVKDRMYDITHLRVDSPRVVHTATDKWSQFDIAMAIQGFRRYGMNLEAIAEIVGSKTEAQILDFYNEPVQTQKLDTLIEQYEVEKSKGMRKELLLPEIIDLC